MKDPMIGALGLLAAIVLVPLAGWMLTDAIAWLA
jgi:hypothetical protein